MEKIDLKSAIWKEGEYYVAQCLNVDVSSFGETKEEALKNLNEALELYFEEDYNIPLDITKIEKPEIINLSLTRA